MTPPAGKKQAAEAPANGDGGLRDRIVEFRRVPAAELQDNEKNWRTHPYAQTQAMAELLQQVGIAGALTAYYSERNGGALTLIDGHERRGHDAEWPTLILDVNDAEADLLLLTLDPTRQMAGTDADTLSALLDETTGTGTVAVEDLLRQLQLQARAEAENAYGTGEAATGGSAPAQDGPPEMLLQAFEHYDYIICLFRSTLDWTNAKDMLGLEPEAFTMKDGVTKRIGRGRVIEGDRLLKILQK